MIESRLRAGVLRKALGAWIALSVQPALADDTAGEADFLFRRGTEAYRRGDFGGALERFLASNRLVPNQNVVFNIAHTYEKLEQFPEAYHYFTLALAGERDAAQVARIRARLAAIERKIAVLIVETTPPGATLYLERKDLGSRGGSPRTLGLAPGPRALIVELAGHHSERVEIPALTAGEERRVHVSLRPVLGELRIDQPPGTRVSAPDSVHAPSCVAPCQLALPPGETRVLLERPGFRAKELSVRIVPDAVKVLSVPELASERGKLVVQSDEPGAQIELSGTILGFTPAVLELPVGVHTLTVLRKGFRPEQRRVSIAADTTTTLSLILNQEEEVTAASRVRERVEEAPSSVTILPHAELDAFRYPTVAEALRGVPGAYVWDDRSYVSVGFRGVSRLGNYGNRVLVLVDGSPLNDNWLGSSYVGYEGRTDLGSIDRIEVVRGPGSVVYGTSAFSGVINLVTRPVAKVPTTRIGVGTEGDGVARARVRSDAPIGDRGGIWTQAAVARGAGRDFYFGELAGAEPSGAGGNARSVDGFDSATVEGQLQYDAVSARWFWHTHDKALPTAPYETLVGDGRTRQRDTRWLLELRAEPRLSRAVSSLSRAHLDHYRFRGAYPRSTDDMGLEIDTFRGSFAGLEQRFEIVPNPNVHLLIGGELQSHFQVEQWAGDEGGVLLDERHPFWIGAGYANADVTPIPALTLNAGARIDAYSTFGSSVNPRASIIVRPYTGGNLKLIGATAFRAPSVYELYYNDAGITQRSSPDLEPERIYSVELEFSHELSPLVTASATLFGNTVHDLVTSRGSGNDLDPLYYENSDVPLASVGGEITLRRDLRNGISWSISYGVIEARYLADGSLGAFSRFERNPRFAEVENVPGQLASFKAIFPFYARALRLASRLTLETGRYDRYERIADEIGQRKTAPVALLDLVVSGQEERSLVDWAFGLYNVFDYRYELPASAELRQRTIPQSGRSLLLTLDVNL